MNGIRKGNGCLISGSIPQGNRYRKIRGIRLGSCNNTDRPVVDRSRDSGCRLCNSGTDIIRKRNKLVIVRHGKRYNNGTINTIGSGPRIVGIIRLNLRNLRMGRFLVNINTDYLRGLFVLLIRGFKVYFGHVNNGGTHSGCRIQGKCPIRIRITRNAREGLHFIITNHGTAGYGGYRHRCRK